MKKKILIAFISVICAVCSIAGIIGLTNKKTDNKTANASNIVFTQNDILQADKTLISAVNTVEAWIHTSTNIPLRKFSCIKNILL